MLNQEGGIIDDLLVYCVTPGAEYMLCVNSSNAEKDFAWLKKHLSSNAVLDDASASTSLIALQGPKAGAILNKVTGFDQESIRYYHFAFADSPFGRLMVSRTGYTGSDGVEIFLPNEKAPALWDAFAGAGAVPCGLGARDTLRLEMGYALHGNDIDETTTPLESGPMFALDMKKAEFIGKDVLDRQVVQGIKKKLVGLVMEERGIPRQGYVCSVRGIPGVITSGSISPMLDAGIALAYMDASAREGDEVFVTIRDRQLRARVAKPPFVKTGLIK
jgi:aminomethyltransferase